MGKRYLTILLFVSVVCNIALLNELRVRSTTLEVPVSETPSPTFPNGGSYPFIRVVDGDTITVGWEGAIEYVRLIGIDAPEPNDPGGPECYASESTDHLQEVLQTGVVTLRFDPTQGLRDKYNRLLAYVELPDGTDVARVMLENGYAQEYTYDRPYERVDIYTQAEADATASLRGLWGISGCN